MTTETTALLARLDCWLARHRPRYHHGLCPAARAAALDSLPQRLSMGVPEELRQLLAWHNGECDDFIGCLEQSWHLMSAAQIVAAKQELDELAEGDPACGWRREWIPFLDDDAGDYLCLDTSQQPAPVRAYWAGQHEHPVVAASLAAWLEAFVTAAERGDYHEDPERGYFLRWRGAATDRENESRGASR